MTNPFAATPADLPGAGRPAGDPETPPSHADIEERLDALLATDPDDFDGHIARAGELHETLRDRLSGEA